MMDNPYQSPQEPSTPFGPGAPVNSPYRPRGLVSHVRVVAILMLVQGGFELLAALGIGAMAIVVPRLMDMHMQQQAPNAPQMPVDLSLILTVEYIVMASAAFIAAVLNIWAGLENYRFRRRPLGFVALAGGLVSLFTCYCFPTGLLLTIYGLIVYLNGSVSEAFRMGDAGSPPNDIFNTFRL
jgi:hypothetical protein